MLEEGPQNQVMAPKRALWLDHARWQRAAKASDSLATLLLIDPIIRLFFPLILKTRVTPNQVTLIGLGISLFSAWMFFSGRQELGGLLFLLWYLVDCIDGKIARLTGNCTAFGHWFDSVSDRIGTGCVLLGLGAFSIQSGDSATATAALVFLVVYFVTVANAVLLSQISSRFRTEGLLSAKAPQNHQSDSKWSPSEGRILTLFETMQRKYRLTPLVLGDPEWLMFGLVLGPLTGFTWECLLIAATAFFLQKAALSVSFWWRRRAEIATT